MITLIVPTRNRSHTLRLVAPSYFQQADVSEIIFVSDAGTDDSEAVIQDIAAKHVDVRTRFIRNPVRLGASQSRNVGVAQASNEFILFCDDDEYLQAEYARICLTKLRQLDAAAVSGRRIYLQAGESQSSALVRFGHGIRRTRPFRKLICEYVNAARFDGDVSVPITNAIILTRKSLLLQYPYDSHYAKGNGYREESDFQMNLFVNGHDLYVTNDCHSFHLPMEKVLTGGQRTGRWVRLCWSVHYTAYFYRKYYAAYARRVGLRAPREMAVAAFALFAVYRETLRPVLYSGVKWWLQQRHRHAARRVPA